MVLTMLFWGVNVSLIKLLINVIPPLVMQGTRIFVAGITLFIILLIWKKKIIYKEMPWKWLLLASFLGVISHHSLLAIGMQSTTTIKTSLILGLAPLITAIIAVLSRSSSLTVISFCGFVIGFVGIVVAVVDNVSEVVAVVSGDFLVLASIIAQAFSFFVIRRITLTIPPLVVTAYLLTIGSIFLMVFNLITNPTSFVAFTQLDATSWGVFLFSAVFATAVGHSMYNSMIKRIGTAETAIFTNLSTIFALTGSAFIIGEEMHLSQVIGCLLIVIGVLIGTGGVEEWLRKRKHQNKEEECTGSI
jgi:drug/metabolite transporter (DMT)-like permease